MPTLLLGNCLEKLAEMADCSIDAIVTDPPYGLSFMGKKWDYDVPGEDIWRECLRVLKPGGHLLAFAGTRTQHRMAVRIEDAGFEIRDMIAWVYGSGFPKSQNVGKAIDKRGGNAGLTAEIGLAIKQARLKRGLSAAACDQMFCGGTTNWSWFEGRPTGQRAPTPDTFNAIAEAWPELEPLRAAVAEAEREVVGKSAHKPGIANGTKGHHTVGGTIAQHVDITAPATPEAQQWDGWGTALKPALEPITVARKPFKGTVAANVLAHGTGGINVDGCRVEAGDLNALQKNWDRVQSGSQGIASTGLKAIDLSNRAPSGRWPANLIHDGSDEVVGLFPESKGQQGAISGKEPSGKTNAVYGEYQQRNESEPRNDAGSAARFFYCAKTSKRERGEGNNHPTVKPIALMRYLCRLVTPPSGTVLDPFMGSGSTGMAAEAEGFDFVGIELDPDYFAIAQQRITNSESLTGDEND
jgi:DNA modification methylase